MMDKQTLKIIFTWALAGTLVIGFWALVNHEIWRECIAHGNSGYYCFWQMK